MIDDLKIIRKKYGEKMYHFCRESFPILLEEPGKLSKLLIDNFHESHSLYNDIEVDGKLGDFKNYIYSLVDVENNNALVENKTPEELMAEAGYNLFECYSEEDIQSYKKYYAQGEALCTFNGGRLKSCRVFFAVKKNVDDIKREDFKNPTRQDEYGTSVISIQFEKDGTNTLSIKNRYNHKVKNPDATFSNNLDNIIPGLTNSFEKYKGIIQKYKNNRFEISNYVRANDGKFYRYNYEINNVYYCPDNIIIDNFEVKKYDKSRYLIIDYFIIDMFKNNRSISMYDNAHFTDGFCDLIKEITKIDVENTPNGKKITILGSNNEYLEILVDKDGKMISLKMDYIYSIGDGFLRCNESLQELYIPKLITVGYAFLRCNESLQELYTPNLETVDDYFLSCNNSLKNLNLPNLKEIGDNFLFYNKSLQELSLPNLIAVGDSFLYHNNYLQKLIVPILTTVGNGFLLSNFSLQKLRAPKLTIVGDGFLQDNAVLEDLSLPNLTLVGNCFLYWNEFLRELSLPKLTTVGYAFLRCNEFLQELYAPNLETVSDLFLISNKKLRYKILSEIEEKNKSNGRGGR